MKTQQNKPAPIASASIRRVLFASSWWDEDLMTKVAKHATRLGWHLNIQACIRNQIPETWDGAGILTMHDCSQKSMQTVLATSKCPVVSLNLNSHPLGIPCVAFDVNKIGCLAAEHFTERGFRSFIYYSHSADNQYSTLLTKSAFHDASCPEPQAFRHLDWQSVRGTNPDTWTSRQQWLREELRRFPKPFAVFSLHPECAIEMIEACLAENIPVPDDVAVMMFSVGIDFFIACSPIPLSSVDADNEAKAEAACDLLESMMNGSPAPNDPVLITPKGITTRTSTDTLAASHPAVAKAIRFMFDSFSEPISVDDITRASGTSQTSLFLHFKRDLGQTPHSVLTRIRTDKAKIMLESTDSKLHVVAENCGFRSLMNLNRNFHKSLNMSPGQYRKHANQITGLLGSGLKIQESLDVAAS